MAETTIRGGVMQRMTMGRGAIRKLLARVTLLVRVQTLGGTRPCRACIRFPKRVPHLIATP
eukprot:4500486-Pleurochrysis_carterae.AAC.1